MPRNSSGNYTLPAGNPVVPNTLIETTWANPTMADIGAGITDSLDRYGRGGMLAQLKLADGTLAQPAFGFNSESSTGIFRPGAGVLGVAVLGAVVASYAAASVTFSQPPIYAADPVTGDQLTRKSYVDNALTTGYLPLTGGTLTGALTTTNGAITAGSTDPAGFAELRAQSTDRLGRFISYPSTHAIRANQVWVNANDAAGLLVLATANIERVRVDAAGNVGIGVAPSAWNANTRAIDLFAQGLGVMGGGDSGTFSVNAYFDLGAVWRYKGTSVYGPTSLALFDGGFVFANAPAGAAGAVVSFVERMRLDAAGHLGVGTATPNKLGVSRTVTVNGSINSAFELAAGDVSCGWLFGNPARVSLETNGAIPLTFNVNGAQRMMLDTAGNVGIGGTPGVRLDVFTASSSQGGMRMSNTESTSRVDFTVSGTVGALPAWANSTVLESVPAGAGGLIFSTYTGNMDFLTGTRTLRMRINATGDVNIAAGTGKLQIGGSPALSTYVNSSWAINAGYTLGHGHGRPADEIQITLQCLVAEAGYAVGDRVRWMPQVSGTTGGYSLRSTAAALTVNTFNAAVQLPHAALGTATAITPANWQLRMAGIWL